MKQEENFAQLLRKALFQLTEYQKEEDEGVCVAQEPPIEYNKGRKHSSRRKSSSKKDDAGKKLSLQVDEINRLQEHINRLRSENEVILNCLNQIIAEREELLQTLEKLKRQKLFSLPELCDYCKNSVTWSDAKDIVTMLKELCRDGNEENMKLIRSVEEEFKKRVYGKTYNNNFTGVIDNLTINE